MKRRTKLPPGFLVAGAVISLNLGLILAILFWPNLVKTRLDFEPRFEGEWRLPSRPVKIATFNVGFGKRLDEAIELLKGEEPDIVCLQEILEEDVKRVERGLGMEGCWFGSSNQSDDGFYGKALFVRGKLSAPQSMPNPQGGSFGVWAVVEIHGGRFLAGSLHLRDLKAPRVGYPARQNEIRALHEAVDRVGAPALFGGDLNHPPSSINYDLMTKRLVDLGAGSGVTHASKVPLVRVDYIFGTREWETVSSKAIKSTISDHYPVIVVARAVRRPVLSSGFRVQSLFRVRGAGFRVGTRALSQLRTPHSELRTNAERRTQNSELSLNSRALSSNYRTTFRYGPPAPPPRPTAHEDDRYRCCLPALAGFTAPCIAWGEEFNATYPRASVAGRPHERLSTLHKRVSGTAPFGAGRNRHLPV